MDALSSIFSRVGGFMSGNGGKLLGVAGLGDQFVENLIQQQKLNAYNNQQQQFQKNPTLAQNQITAMTQPLDQNLVASVTNQVQGNLGAQGLAESPNIMASVLGQALAPYNQQNSAQATQLWQAIHGQPPAFGQANMNPLFAMLLRQNQGGNGNFLPNNVANLDSVLFPSIGSSSGGSLEIGDLANWGLSDGQAAA